MIRSEAELRSMREGRRGLSAAVGTVTRMIGTRRELHRFELEPEVREGLDSLSDSD
jgi:hypothetical protein